MRLVCVFPARMGQRRLPCPLCGVLLGAPTVFLAGHSGHVLTNVVSKRTDKLVIPLIRRGLQLRTCHYLYRVLTSDVKRYGPHRNTSGTMLQYLHRHHLVSCSQDTRQPQNPPLSPSALHHATITVLLHSKPKEGVRPRKRTRVDRLEAQREVAHERPERGGCEGQDEDVRDKKDGDAGCPSPPECVRLWVRRVDVVNVQGLAAGILYALFGSGGLFLGEWDVTRE
ncbi:hypothetical protein C8Q70DRAFT_527984 [Cubamyces menziesii]|nr:hypothetical protein C8Q70DRAFT_527984 [Cubamyces menziesii]